MDMMALTCCEDNGIPGRYILFCDTVVFSSYGYLSYDRWLVACTSTTIQLCIVVVRGHKYSMP